MASNFHYINEMRTCDDNISDITLIPDSSGCIIYIYKNNDFSSSLWGATTKTVTVKYEKHIKSLIMCLCWQIR
ncbi:hypothetical protein KQI42_00585 [Tissierella sp. MSJ-40]|uniref:Uncharacterized protein n=1 Tax=Tissierella simiarum TaxID=2841534 RepID=A0ABS6E2I7_9FIRM|nr:hypothetical protein [Tissierella simiarum]MBU5436479.1 hypothetical protein [Tissierella simiarum]